MTDTQLRNFKLVTLAYVLFLSFIGVLGFYKINQIREFQTPTTQNLDVRGASASAYLR